MRRKLIISFPFAERARSNEGCTNGNPGNKSDQGILFLWYLTCARKKDSPGSLAANHHDGTGSVGGKGVSGALGRTHHVQL